MGDQRRLTVSDIVVGEPLAWDVYAEDGKLLLRRGHIVQSDSQVEGLLKRGLYVTAVSTNAPGQGRAAKPQTERPSTLRLINLANKRLEKLLYNLANEPDVENKLLEIVKALIFAAQFNPDIAIGAIFLNREMAHYSIRHSVDTALLAHAVARAMSCSDEDITCIMAAALTMNVATLRLQDQWQARAGPLSEREQQLVDNHPRDGARMLREAGVSNSDWLRYVEQHHLAEEADAGTSTNIKILAFADQYCASITERSYRKPLLPASALRDVLIADGKPRDPLIAAYFIKELGPYPPGTWVRLQCGEIGVVTQRGNTPNTPVVHALIGPRGAPLSFAIRRDTSKDLYVIRETLRPEGVGLRFSLQQLWGNEAAP